MEINISISNEIKEASNNQIVLGVVYAEVENSQRNEELLSEIDKQLKNLQSITLDTLIELQEIKALRETYKNLGKPPSRYRGSNEALLRRIIQGKGIYQINTIVDINNLISLFSKRSVGTYDLENLNGDILMRT